MRKGVWHIGTFAGIPVKIHFTFALVFLIFAFPNAGKQDFWITFLWESLFIILLFTCVVLHEYGHALTARRFGVSTREIVLLPIGGLAMLERLPEKPWQEFLIAIAGPLVNFTIAFLLSAYFFFYPIGRLFEAEITEQSNLLSQPEFFIPALFFTNLMLGIFNLVPAFPMDGGRILRALLAIRLGRISATRIASVVGQIFSLLFVGLAFYTGSVVLGFIGIFIFLAARRENQMVQADQKLSRYTVQDALRTQFTTFFPWEPMSGPLSIYQQGIERNFLIVDEEQRVVGMLYEDRLREAVHKGVWNEPVSEYMSEQVEAVSLGLSLQQVLQKMQSSEVPLFPALDERGQAYGVIDARGLNRLLSSGAKPSV